MELINAVKNSRTWTRHGVKIAWGGAIILLLLAIAKIAYSEYSNQQIKLVDYAPQDLPPIQNNTKPPYRVTDITSANLFGDPRPKEVITKNIPKTNLNLKLVGVLWASDQQMARVVIQSGNSKANLYGVGESIEGANASVKEIRTNEILISRNGATEKLTLVKKKSSSDIISFAPVDYDESVPVSYNEQSSANIGRVTNSKPISPNGANRKIRKPNFSGLDRALKKMDEL